MLLSMGSLEESLAVGAALGPSLPLGPPEILGNICKL